VQKTLSIYPKVKFSKGRKIGFNPGNFYVKKTGAVRDWLMYSTSSNSLFCYCCSLFHIPSSSNSKWKQFGIGNVGFRDYLHQGRGISDHENSEQHFQSTIKWKEFMERSKAGRNIDSAITKQYQQEVTFWRKVLTGLLDAIMYLARNNLAFLGSSHRIGEPDSGNFLSLVELLSKYYAPLAVHVSRVKAGETNITYLSPKIQNKFIDIIAIVCMW